MFATTFNIGLVPGFRSPPSAARGPTGDACLPSEPKQSRRRLHPSTRDPHSQHSPCHNWQRYLFTTRALTMAVRSRKPSLVRIPVTRRDRASPTRRYLTPLRMRHNIWWCLHKLNQHPFPTQRGTPIALGVNKSHVVATCPFPDAPRSEAHSSMRQPLHALGERVYPQTDVIQSRNMNPARHGGE